MAHQLTKLYIEPTTACNLDCAMCVRREWGEPTGQMSLDTFADLMEQVRAFADPPIIHLSGYGEPMCHVDFLEVVRLAKATGGRVEMTTNGMLLDEEKAEALVELELDRLTVSIDGVSPEGFADVRVDGNLPDVIANIERLHRLVLRHRGRRGKPHIGIAFVAMRRNVGDLAKLPLLANRLHRTLDPGLQRGTPQPGDGARDPLWAGIACAGLSGIAVGAGAQSAQARLLRGYAGTAARRLQLDGQHHPDGSTAQQLRRFLPLRPRGLRCRTLGR